MIKEKETIIKRLLHSKLVVVFEVIVLVGLTSALVKEVIGKYQVQGEINDLQSQLTQLEQKNEELNQLISQLGSSNYTEEQARLKLGLQKPGESVVSVLGANTDEQNDPSADVSEGTDELSAQSTANPSRWFDYFFSEKNQS